MSNTNNLRCPRKLNQADASGWSFDYSELKDFTQFINEARNTRLSMEDVEAVLICLDESPAPVSKSVEERAKEEADHRYPEELNPHRSTARNQRKNQRIFIEGALWASRSLANTELEELREWKRLALEVMPDFQEIGKLIGVPIGASVHEKIIPWIKNAKARTAISGSCECPREIKTGQTSVMCCNICGMPDEDFWKPKPGILKEDEFAKGFAEWASEQEYVWVARSKQWTTDGSEFIFTSDLLAAYRDHLESIKRT